MIMELLGSNLSSQAMNAKALSQHKAPSCSKPSCFPLCWNSVCRISDWLHSLDLLGKKTTTLWKSLFYSSFFWLHLIIHSLEKDIRRRELYVQECARLPLCSHMVVSPFWINYWWYSNYDWEWDHRGIRRFLSLHLQQDEYSFGELLCIYSKKKLESECWGKAIKSASIDCLLWSHGLVDFNWESMGFYSTVSQYSEWKQVVSCSCSLTQFILVRWTDFPLFL